MKTKFSPKQIEVAHKIAAFYLNKNNGDEDKANIDLEGIRINEITINSNSIDIFTSRPGLIIGYQGHNIQKLSEFLGTVVRVHQSDSILDYLYIQNPLDGDYDY